MKALFAFFLFLGAAFGRGPVLVHRLIVLPTSTLSIGGRTNVNSFACTIAHYFGTDTLVLHEGGANVRPVFVKGSVDLDASTFDCGMAMLTSDFRKTLKSNQHPAIVIDFISFERMPRYALEEEIFKGILKISLAGVTKLFEVDCSIEAKPTGLIHLKGARSFLFSDFNLVAPSHVLGAVKVKDKLNVKFHLILKLDPDP